MMRFLLIAAVALMGFSLQARADSGSTVSVSTEQDVLVTRVSEDGTQAQVQQADGKWADIAVSPVTKAQLDQAVQNAISVENSNPAAQTEKAQLVWGHWHHHIYWGHHWYHPHHEWHGGGWHYHQWHRNHWHGGWHHHGWWRHRFDN